VESQVVERYLLVWDLDGTIGDFGALEGDWTLDSPVRIRIRPGMAEALQALGRAGFLHTLLTTSALLYAEIALRAAGLRDLFARLECRGQRPKGDAAGVAAAFAIPPRDRAARVLFVGDRLDFDEPDDPEVVFHLEPWALARPAAQLARLVEHLRETGGGSIREGFRRVGRGPRRWQLLFRRPPVVVGETVERQVAGLGLLLLLERSGKCPVIGFGEPPAGTVTASEHEVVPARVAAALAASRPFTNPA
jgi:hypothetical protein